MHRYMSGQAARKLAPAGLWMTAYQSDPATVSDHSLPRKHSPGTGRTTTRPRCHRTGGFPAFAATPFGAV
ncbi:unnamed protein product [Scytosiphon promiscuus]